MDSQEARIYTVVLIISVTLGVIIAYFIISIIRQQRRNLELQKASILAELSAMEKERARIAADLHDDLGPVLSVIKFQVDNVEDVKGEEKEQLAEASQHLDGLISRMREIANNLMPSALHRKGLITAIDEFISKASEAGKLQIHFRYPENLHLPEEISINIYRAIQEVVHNCMKHAKASELQIIMGEKNGALTILCRDNGKGFDYLRLSKESSGIGLKSLKNRTEMIGGTLQVESKEGKGSAFLFEIPIK
jgi:signal transduction histidine kinase